MDVSNTIIAIEFSKELLSPLHLLKNLIISG